MSDTQKPQRIILFDALKLFAIFLVLWGHVIQHLLSSDYQDEPVYRHIYSFHMPLFMMITGYFYAKTFRKGFAKSIVHKFRQLLLPAITWTVIFCFLQTFKMGLPSINSIVNGWIYNFWFLKSAFLCSVICYPICKLHNYSYLSGGVIICASQFIYGDNHLQLAFMIPCFITGVWLQFNDCKVIQATSNKALIIITGLIAVLGNFFLDSSLYRQMTEAFELSLWQSPTIILLRLFRLALGISGSLFIILLFKGIFDRFKDSQKGRMITLLGSETLGVYILQTYIVEYFLARHLNLDSLNFIVCNFVIAPIISLIVLALSVMIIKGFKRNQYLAFALFGSKLPQRPTKVPVLDK